MADILLQNSNITGDQDALAQVLNKMDREIDDFVDLVKANIELFLGNSRDAATTKLGWLTDISNGLIKQFGIGNQKLNDMVNIINNHDVRAANVIAG